MAVQSTMLELGSPLPALRLPDAVSGEPVDAAALARGQKGLLVAFLCNHCPYVQHVLPELLKVAHGALDQGFAVVAVNSNDEGTYPQDGPSAMRELARAQGWRLPFLFDATQEVAKAFRAACTPDLYLFDAQLRLAYRGRFDDSTPKNGKPVTGAALRTALEAVAAGRAPGADQVPSLGCNIKWRPGNEPPWYG